MARRELLLGEWACLGVIVPAPTHGFAVAAQLQPHEDIGRIWSLSRPLTYRALEQLGERGYVQPVGEEPGRSGPNRTILAATRTGRRALHHWVRTPTEHLRDLRSELLLKLALARRSGLDVSDMLIEQRRLVEGLALAYRCAADETSEPGSPDIVGLWRSEAALAGLRFLDQLLGDDRSRW